jgi:hypothetical protein
MDPAASFLLVVVSLQAVFVAAVILLIGRRFPKRIPVYRWVAPAALPMLLFLMATFAYVNIETGQGIAVGSVELTPVLRLFLADATLWLLGVLFASLLVRLTRR